MKHGEIEVNLLDKIGYDIATIGNHEFDDGPQNLAKQLKLASYQIVCANLHFSALASLDALITPSIIKER